MYRSNVMSDENIPRQLTHACTVDLGREAVGKDCSSAVKHTSAATWQYVGIPGLYGPSSQKIYLGYALLHAVRQANQWRGRGCDPGAVYGGLEGSCGFKKQLEEGGIVQGLLAVWWRLGAATVLQCL